MKKLSNRKRFKPFIIVLTIILVIVGVIILIMHALNAPANGTIIKATQSDSLTTPQPSIKTLDSKYFTATYSGRYRELKNLNPSASLQSWTLQTRVESGAGESRKLSIVVTTLPAGGVQDDSAYRLYNAHPELYTITQAYYGGDPVIVAKRTSPSYQQTVLWPHNGYLLTVSLTAEVENDIINGEFQSFLTSLKWHE